MHHGPVFWAGAGNVKVPGARPFLFLVAMTTTLFECESTVTIREIAAEASRLTGLRVRPSLVRRIRKQLASSYHERQLDHIDAQHNPWLPNGPTASTGKLGPTYTFNDFRASRLLRAVVQYVQSKYVAPSFLRVTTAAPFGFFS